MITKKHNSDAQESKKDQKKSNKQNDNTTTRLALKKLEKEKKKSHGLVDKTIRKASEKATKTKITSHKVLQHKCNMLMIHLQQKMQHALAKQISELSKLIKKDMSQDAMKKIIDAAAKTAEDHGYNFFKP